MAAIWLFTADFISCGVVSYARDFQKSTVVLLCGMSCKMNKWLIHQRTQITTWFLFSVCTSPTKMFCIQIIRSMFHCQAFLHSIDKMDVLQKCTICLPCVIAGRFVPIAGCYVHTSYHLPYCSWIPTSTICFDINSCVVERVFSSQDFHPRTASDSTNECRKLHEC